MSPSEIAAWLEDRGWETRVLDDGIVAARRREGPKRQRRYVKSYTMTGSYWSIEREGRKR